MTANTKKVIIAALRKAAALAVAGVATWVASPAALNIVPTEYIWVVSVVVAPLLWELDKYLGGPGKPSHPKAVESATNV